MATKAYDGKGGLIAQLEYVREDDYDLKGFLFEAIGIRMSVQCGPLVRSAFRMGEEKKAASVTRYPVWKGVVQPMHFGGPRNPAFELTKAVEFEVALIDESKSAGTQYHVSWLKLGDVLKRFPPQPSASADLIDALNDALKFWTDDHVASFVPAKAVHAVLTHLAAANGK